MPAVNEAAVLSAQMEKVLPAVNVLYDRDDTFYSSIEKEKNVEKVSGRDMRVPMKMRPGGYFGHFNPDGGDLGRGGGPTWDKAVIPTVHIRYACEWTKKAEWGTDDARKAVINAFKDIMADAMPEFRRNSDALCMTAGNGILGTVSAVSTSGGVDTVTLGTDGFGAMLLRFGLKVNIYDATLATQRTIALEPEITFYDLANKQIKLTPATAGITATDVIVISGLSGANPVSLYGVPYHNNSASTGTWLGLSRADYPEIRATRVNAAGSLAVSHPRLALNKLLDRWGKKGKKIKLKAVMNPAQADAYEQLGMLVTNLQRGPGQSSGLDLYFNPDDMRMAGAPVELNTHWDKTRIDFIAPEMWGRAEMHAPGFYKSADGTKIFPIRGASGGVAAADIFYIVASWNLFMKNPAAAAYIDGLTVPAGY